MTNRAIPAAAPAKKFIPAYTITELDGTYKRRIAKMIPLGKMDKNGNQKHRIEYEEIEKPKKYLVTTPKNGSFHIDSYEELERLGLTNTEVPLVINGDNDGEPVGSIPNVIRKAKGGVNA